MEDFFAVCAVSGFVYLDDNLAVLAASWQLHSESWKYRWAMSWENIYLYIYGNEPIYMRRHKQSWLPRFDVMGRIEFRDKWYCKETQNIIIAYLFSTQLTIRMTSFDCILGYQLRLCRFMYISILFFENTVLVIY